MTFKLVCCMSVPIFIEVPEIIKEFYEKFEYRSHNSKVKLVAHCKKCSKAITANWKPQRVTSNLISHVKVRILKSFTVCQSLCRPAIPKVCHSEGPPFLGLGLGLGVGLGLGLGLDRCYDHEFVIAPSIVYDHGCVLIAHILLNKARCTLPGRPARTPSQDARA